MIVLLRELPHVAHVGHSAQPQKALVGIARQRHALPVQEQFAVRALFAVVVFVLCAERAYGAQPPPVLLAQAVLLQIDAHDIVPRRAVQPRARRLVDRGKVLRPQRHAAV